MYLRIHFTHQTWESQQDIEKALSTLDKISDDDLQYLGSFCREIALKKFSFDQFSGNVKNILFDI